MPFVSTRCLIIRRLRVAIVRSPWAVSQIGGSDGSNERGSRGRKIAMVTWQRAVRECTEYRRARLSIIAWGRRARCPPSTAACARCRGDNLRVMSEIQPTRCVRERHKMRATLCEMEGQAARGRLGCLGYRSALRYCVTARRRSRHWTACFPCGASMVCTLIDDSS